MTLLLPVVLLLGSSHAPRFFVVSTSLPWVRVAAVASEEDDAVRCLGSLRERGGIHSLTQAGLRGRRRSR